MEQRQRLYMATAVGTAAAALMAFIAALIMSQGKFEVTVIAFPLCAATATFLSVFFIWRRALLKRETRKRGFWIGVVAGLIAHVIMMCLAAWVMFTPEAIENGFSSEELVAVLFGMPAIMIVLGFAFGGFLSLPAGALLGWLFSRNDLAAQKDVFE